MDILLFALQVAFIMPMLVRVLRRERPTTPIGRELASSFQAPGLMVHATGLLLVWIGFDVSWWSGGVARAVTWRGSIAASLLLVATLLMVSAFAALRSWRLLPTIGGGHELCTSGPYRLVRHPIYLAFDLLGIALAVAAPHPLVIIGAVLLVLAGDRRARAEERAMLNAFGARYGEYMGRVARRIPGVY